MDSPHLGDEKDHFYGIIKTLPAGERIISRLVREGKGFLKKCRAGGGAWRPGASVYDLLKVDFFGKVG